jgi:hypothetical protein
VSRVFKKDTSWWIDFNDAQGVRHRKKVGPNRRVAQEVLNDVLGKVARRQHLGVMADSALSFAEFAKTWWERVSGLLKPRTRERWRGILDQHLKSSFPGALRATTRAQAESYVSRRIEQGAAPQHDQPGDHSPQAYALASHALGVLEHQSSCWNKAASRTVGTNPIPQSGRG